MNNEEKNKIKVGISIAAFSVILFLVMKNFGVALNTIKQLSAIFSSFIGGICIAFVLNVLMSKIEGKLLCKNKWYLAHKKLIRPTSLLVTLIIFFGILSLLISFVIPQFAASAKTLANNFSGYLSSLNEFLNNFLSKFGISANLNDMITSLFAELSDYVITFISTAAPKVLTATMNITSGIVNAFIAFIFAIYMLSSKESLLRGSKKLVYAFIPRKGADYTTEVYRLIKARFSGFVTGQLTEAVIMGVLCFIGMNLFNMQYALLISVIIGVTNMIPVVGPIIGAVPGALIMLLVDPVKALWFILFIIVLQQLESNLIYPKVVGDSIGLPGIWVLFAIIVGGNWFGFLGILLGVPVFAVIFTLLSKHTNERLRSKGLIGTFNKPTDNTTADVTNGSGNDKDNDKNNTSDKHKGEKNAVNKKA